MVQVEVHQFTDEPSVYFCTLSILKAFLKEKPGDSPIFILDKVAIGGIDFLFANYLCAVYNISYIHSMFSNRKNNIKLVIVGLIIFSLSLCCAGAWQGTLFSGMDMDSASSCHGGGVGNATDTGHHSMVLSSGITWLQNIVIVLSFSLLVSFLLLLVSGKFVGYTRGVRDKYGGFVCFNYFVFIFRRGLLHPKVL